jgi:hypothetical protein
MTRAWPHVSHNPAGGRSRRSIPGDSTHHSSAFARGKLAVQPVICRCGMDE